MTSNDSHSITHSVFAVPHYNVLKRKINNKGLCSSTNPCLMSKSDFLLQYNTIQFMYLYKVSKVILLFSRRSAYY